MHLFKLLVWLGILPKPVVKHGSTRVVWIFPKFAVKFTKVEMKKLCKIIWKFRKNKQMLKIIFKSKSPSFPWTLYYFLTKGFLDNWGEYMFYLRNKKSPFIFPTYFSLFGIFNITPIGKELEKNPLFFLGSTFKNEDKHHFAKSTNFCIYQGRTCMWDYGDSLTQSVILGNIDIMNKFSLEADLK
jgi:hypothetical protein